MVENRQGGMRRQQVTGKHLDVVNIGWHPDKATPIVLGHWTGHSKNGRRCFLTAKSLTTSSKMGDVDRTVSFARGFTQEQFHWLHRIRLQYQEIRFATSRDVFQVANVRPMAHHESVCSQLKPAVTLQARARLYW